MFELLESNSLHLNPREQPTVFPVYIQNFSGYSTLKVFGCKLEQNVVLPKNCFYDFRFVELDVSNLASVLSRIFMGRFIYILDSSMIVHSHFDLVSSLLALEATEPVSEPVNQMALELINNHLISV